MSAKDEYAVVELIDKLNEEINNIKKKYNENIKSAKFKVEIAGCKHTYFSTSEQESDNGYGKWHTSLVKRCKVCGEETVHEEWPLE